MNWKLNDNSFSQFLLRSSWWLSFAIGAAASAVAIALLPEPYRAFGAMTGLPFFVIGMHRAWKQWRCREVADRRDARGGSAMTWPEFSREIEALATHGVFSNGVPERVARTSKLSEKGAALVHCKRWKVARIRDRRSPSSCVDGSGKRARMHFVSAGEISDNARAFAGQAPDRDRRRPRARALCQEAQRAGHQRTCLKEALEAAGDEGRREAWNADAQRAVPSPGR
jgi:hypothetical protein